MDQKDENFAKIYEKSKVFILENMNYFRMIKIINDAVSYNSELIYQFLDYFQEYNRLIESSKSMPLPESNRNSNDMGEYLEPNSDNFVKRFCCPISKFIMTDPYVNKCGHSFEFASIIKYLKANSEGKCPSCNQPINMSSIVPNNELRDLINDWIKNRDSEYFETPLATVIKNEAEFLKEMENKNNMEQHLKELKLDLEMTEFKLKETNLRIENWQKKQKIIQKDLVPQKASSYVSNFMPQIPIDSANKVIPNKLALPNGDLDGDEQKCTPSDYSDSSDYEEIVNINSLEEKF